MNEFQLESLQDQLLAHLRDNDWMEDIDQLLKDADEDSIDPAGDYGNAWFVLQLGLVSATLGIVRRMK